MTSFAALPKDVQRAALAVTHIEDVTLATVLKAVESRRRQSSWGQGSGVDHFMWEIRCAVISQQRPLAQVVSLDSFRLSKGGTP